MRRIADMVKGAKKVLQEAGIRQKPQPSDLQAPDPMEARPLRPLTPEEDRMYEKDPASLLYAALKKDHEEIMQVVRANRAKRSGTPVLSPTQS
jgi:hypothetical protein